MTSLLGSADVDASFVGAPGGAPGLESGCTELAPVGDRTRFEDCYEELYARAYRVAMRLTQDRERAADFAQETMVRAYQRWRKLRGDEHRAAWVCRVVTNLVIDDVRRRDTATRFAEQLVPAASGTYGEIDRRLDLEAAIATLSHRQREVIGLRYLADVSESETAAALGCSTGTVRQHCARGLAALRERMGADVDLVARESGYPEPPRAGATGAAIAAGAKRRARRHAAITGGVALAVAVILAVFGVAYRPNDDFTDEKRTTTTTTPTTTVPAPTTTVPFDGVTTGGGVAMSETPGGSATVAPGATSSTGDVAGSGGPLSPPTGSPTAAIPTRPGGTGGSNEPAPTDGSTPATPTAVPSGPPTAQTTGVPPGTVLQASGSIDVTTDGAVIDGLDVDGCITVDAANVTIRNTRVSLNGSCWRGIDVIDGGRGANVLIEAVEIDAHGDDSRTCSIVRNTVMRHVHLHGCGTGVLMRSGTSISDSYVHDVVKAVESQTADDVTIRSNVLDARGGDAAVMIGDVDGRVGNVTVDGNQLDGGSYVLYGGSQHGTVPVRLTVTNNAFGTDFAWGTHAAVASSTIWSGNVRAADGTTIAR